MTLSVHENILPATDNRSVCNLMVHHVQALASYVAKAVVDFFTYLIMKISQAMNWLSATTARVFCCKSDIQAPPFAIPPLTKNQKIEIVAEKVLTERKQAALERLAQLKRLPDDAFECSPEILSFDLEEILQKYDGNQRLDRWNIWFRYARPEGGQRTKFSRILDRLGENPNNEKYQLVRNLLGKIHCILTDKQARIQTLPIEEQFEAHRALKEEVGYIICRLIDADSNCIDQTLTQLEDIVIIVVASDLPQQKDMTSLLRYKAAYILFRERIDCLKRLLITDSDPEISGNAHQADLEREVKKRAANCLGIKGKIFETGAQFSVNFTAEFTEQLVERATNRLCERFYDKYRPHEYFQNQCQTPTGDCKKFRNELMQWAADYYGLGSTTIGEDEIFDDLSKAVSNNPEDLDTMMSVAAVQLTRPGIQLFLEAAGIIYRT